MTLAAAGVVGYSMSGWLENLAAGAAKNPIDPHAINPPSAIVVTRVSLFIYSLPVVDRLFRLPGRPEKPAVRRQTQRRFCPDHSLS